VSPDSPAESGALKNGVASATPGGSHNARTFPSTQISYAFIAALLASLIVFWAPLRSLVKFSGNSEYSYIPLMPLISAFVIYARKDTILKNAKPSPWIGSSIVTGGILVLLLGNFFRIDSIGRLELFALAIVSTWCGLFVICYGTKALHRAILPMCLLLFMVPAPERVMNSVVQFLQHGSAVLSYHLFRAIGVPAVREGMMISLPGVTVEVAPECSGIRSSISLLILTLAAANLYLRSNWNKVLLVLTLVPLMLLKNAIRIVTLSTLAVYVNSGFLNGRLHHRGGIVFFLIAVAMLLPLVALLRRHERKRGLAAHPLQVNPRSR
jgi:exosortase